MNIKLFERIKGFLIRRYKWYILYPIARRQFRKYKILDSFESIQYIIDHKCSVSRFGEGEVGLMYGREIGFQSYDSQLAMRLLEVLQSEDAPNFVIGIPLTLKTVEHTVGFAYEFWGGYVFEYGTRWSSLLREDYTYIDALISRFFIDYNDYERSTRHINMLKELWRGRDIVIIEGSLSRTGVGNNLYDDAKSIQRILGFPTNAFSHYDRIFEAVISNVTPEENKLLLLSYGPTATILAYDLAKLGYQAIDIGHLDMEYEFYLSKNPNRRALNYKYVNEAKGGDIVEDCNDAIYLNQIICDITKD